LLVLVQSRWVTGANASPEPRSGYVDVLDCDGEDNN
jgi:hypothetical protein